MLVLVWTRKKNEFVFFQNFFFRLFLDPGSRRFIHRHALYILTYIFTSRSVWPNFQFCPFLGPLADFFFRFSGGGLHHTPYAKICPPEKSKKNLHELFCAIQNQVPRTAKYHKKKKEGPPVVSPEATAAFLSLTQAQNGHVSGTLHARGGQKCPDGNPKKGTWSGGKPNWQKAQNKYQQASPSQCWLNPANSRGG